MADERKVARANDDDAVGDDLPVAEPESLPTLKVDLVGLAIERRIPSYKAWAMTVDELKEALRG